MKNYDMKNIRNIALLGSSGAGKTTLAENLLYTTKMITRIGKVDDGNTVMDFDPEEIEKKNSLSLSCGFIDYKNHRINIIDAPGTPDYIGDQLSVFPAVETICVVANAAGGFEVGLEKALEQLEGSSKARALIVNRLDQEHSDFNKVIETISENSDFNATPFVIPIGSESAFKGVIDILKNKAYIDGKVADIPADMADEIEEKRNTLMEAVAESDEELLEKFFDAGELTQDEMIKGAKTAIKNGSIMPAFAVSAASQVGLNNLLEAILEYLPSPADCANMEILEKDEKKEFVCSPDGKVLGFIFKNYADPTMGDIAYFRLYSGSLTSGTDVYIPEKENKDKVGNLYYAQGKNRVDASEIKAGEIGALVKLKYARSMDSIVENGSNMQCLPVKFPDPVMWKSIVGESQNDEDKIGVAIQRLMNEDPTINLKLNVETHENILSGTSEQQLLLLQKKLKNRYKVNAVLKAPRIPYRETITGKTDVEYKHKKQSGGKGQYGHVFMRIGPKARGEGYEFINSIVGGTIPSGYIPAVEKGINETMINGIIAGYPVVDIYCDLYYGSYHDVDSSEMAFKLASTMALKNGFTKCNPILLEPIHSMKIVIPTEYMGDVMGDISTRRGKIVGMEQEGRKQILTAELPLAEIYKYFPTLKSLTQGRGKFTQSFSHYEKVPNDEANKIIEESKQEQE
jgi:elongation factor G